METITRTMLLSGHARMERPEVLKIAIIEYDLPDEECRRQAGKTMTSTTVESAVSSFGECNSRIDIFTSVVAQDLVQSRDEQFAIGVE
jgi:hypothetical protein